MADKIIVLGGGEHARVVMEAILLQPETWELIGFLDPEESIQKIEGLNVQRLGDDNTIPELLKKYPDVKFVCGMGPNQVRRKLVKGIDLTEDKWAVVIHPEASVSKDAVVSAGSVVLRRVIVQPGSLIGKHCILNSGSIIEHDSEIGNFSHIAPGAVAGGGVKLGTDCFIGLGSRIRDHIVIGNGVTVGTGSVVVTDIDDEETVVGVPARRIGASKRNIDIHEICISPEATLYEAMSVIGKYGTTLALVTDAEYKLIGLLSDGDVRRALLNKNDLNTSVRNVMNEKFRFVRQDVARSAALDQLKALGRNHMPILDDDGKVVGLHLLNEMIGTAKLPNIAVIMAGGKGTRLKPLTDNLPKPMVKVAGRPILEHIVLHLAGSNIRDIYIAVNYLSEVIEDYFKDGSTFGVNIHYLREKDPLGTGGALGLLPNIPEEPIIVMNGDLVTQFDIERMLHHHYQGDYKLTIGAHDYRVDIPYGVIEWDEAENKVEGIIEKPEKHFLVNGGIYVISPEIIGLIEPNRKVPMTELIEKAMEKDLRVGAHLVEGDWIDVGHHKELAAARGL